MSLYKCEYITLIPHIHTGIIVASAEDCICSDFRRAHTHTHTHTHTHNATGQLTRTGVATTASRGSGHSPPCPRNPPIPACALVASDGGGELGVLLAQLRLARRGGLRRGDLVQGALLARGVAVLAVDALHRHAVIRTHVLWREEGGRGVWASESRSVRASKETQWRRQAGRFQAVYPRPTPAEPRQPRRVHSNPTCGLAARAVPAVAAVQLWRRSPRP